MLLAILAASGMVFVASGKSKQLVAKGSIKAQVIDQASQRDTDTDGLKDWEEVIAGTDPQNPDSDGNGILDGTDRASTLAFQNEILDKDGGLTLPSTELRRTLSDYIEGRVKENGTITTDDFNDSLKSVVTDNTIVATEKILDQRDPYTKNDLRIDASADPKTYFNTMGRIGEKYFPLGTRSGGVGSIRAFALLAERKNEDGTTMSDGQREEILQRIAGFRSKYAGFASELKGVPVPPALSDFHLEFTNFMANTALAVHHISLLDTDPILGIIGIEHYKILLQEGLKVLATAREETQKYNIVFTEQDSRYARYYFSTPKS
ncbi:MAG: hypothetical protein EXS68_02085 [Candidatus Ryanbacteria bacterium]|nr:hypothetical protein [Candidatus Ryanbacteria bacterium]